jgi:hypothetical protein
MTGSVTVTPYESRDREAVLALAPRLCTGVAEWRPNDGVRSAVREWFEESVDTADDGQTVFVAHLDDRVVGMVAVSEQRHWSGGRDAYVGELPRGGDSTYPGPGETMTWHPVWLV